MQLRSFRAAFTVSDMDRSLAFYCDVLGLEVLYDRVRDGEAYELLTGFADVKMRIALLKDAGTEYRLELVQYLNPPVEKVELKNNQVGASNVCYFVDDLEAAYASLVEAKVNCESAPIEFVREGRATGKILYLYDPDGITVCLYQPYDN